LKVSWRTNSIFNQADKMKQVNNNYQLKKIELGEYQQKWEALADQIMELEA
jgi:ATP-binding cassette subfamily F protein 3